ncbi:MAG: Arc family DNA binding domain-containing protein [Candidatus Competibacteraceae bacterium]|nr:Arc family DNA binding domain-containing protein [Candidatus Competibacteraceae bacterium]
MNTKKTFVLRLDEDTFKALEKWASDEFRSVNGQVEWLINRGLENAGRSKKKKSKKEDEGETQS